MIFRKRAILVVSSIIAIGICVLSLTECDQYSAAPYHKFVKTEEFKKLSRTDQIAKCASCHKQEYENEMKGPHANAYDRLMQHKDFINSDKYQCEFYTKYTNIRFDNCWDCHASQNLYETKLKDDGSDRLKFIDGIIHSKNGGLPKKRPEPAQRVTGVDCMNCHYDGDKMLSLKHQFTKDDSIPGKQTLATITAANMTCYLCHKDEAKSIDPAMTIRLKGSMQCINCHQEYDQKGKGTHYYYWQHDPADKKNAKIPAMMDDFHLQLSADHKSNEIVWVNTCIPHRLTPFPETIIKCEVLNKDSQQLGIKVIRLNNRKEFNPVMYGSFGDNYLGGIDGDAVLLDGTPQKYPIDIKNAASAALFKISIIRKTQYWFPDSLGALADVKYYPCKQ